jgi:hypothetical protein
MASRPVVMVTGLRYVRVYSRPLNDSLSLSSALEPTVAVLALPRAVCSKLDDVCASSFLGMEPSLLLLLLLHPQTATISSSSALLLC